MIILIITLLSLSYLIFDKACQDEWNKEDVELLMTEGTGHD